MVLSTETSACMTRHPLKFWYEIWLDRIICLIESISERTSSWSIIYLISPTIWWLYVSKMKRWSEVCYGCRHNRCILFSLQTIVKSNAIGTNRIHCFIYTDNKPISGFQDKTTEEISKTICSLDILPRKFNRRCRTTNINCSRWTRRII